MTKVSVTYRKSAIGYGRPQKETLRSLGLRRLGQTVVHEDTESIRGMIARVSHLVQVEEASS